MSWLHKNGLTEFIGKLGITATFGAIYIYTTELLPTSVRTAALGTSSMCGRMGAILSPYIASLKVYGLWIPLTIFGVNALLSGCLILLLPETLGKDLPETIKDAINLSGSQRSDSALPISTGSERFDREAIPGPSSQINNKEENEEGNASLSEFEDDDQAVISFDDRGPLILNSDILS